MQINWVIAGRIIAVVLGGLFLGLGIAKLYFDYKRRQKKEREGKGK